MSFITRSRVGLTVAIVGASTVVACGPMPGEEVAPQFPQGQPIGADGFPSSDPGAFPDVHGVAYGRGAMGEGGPSGAIGVGADGAGGYGAGGYGASEQEGESYADADPSALTDFHAALDPYGTWVDDANYGTIWQPSAEAVGNDFAPYESAGHWAYGDDYTWVSDYSWGWAPFHYGRWVYATNGWGWIPGRQYAGAWTSWRVGYGASEGYVGWAPLPPTWYWRGGYAVGIGIVPPAPYAFCATGNLFAPSLAGRMIAGPQVGAVGQNSRPVTPAGVVGRGSVGYGVAAASPTGGGRTLAHPEVAGPSPSSLHISQNAVTRPPRNNPGLNRAMQFAHPATAVALGAHAPYTPNASRSVGSASASNGRGYGGGAVRPSTGTYAYGSYSNSFHGQTRTIGGGEGAISRPSYYGRESTTLHGIGGATYGHTSSFGSHGFTYGGGHGGGGGVGQAAPTSQPPVYGGGYHPSSSGGGGGGHFGGHGGGGGGHGGGHR